MKRGANLGLTLIEVLVALAVLAINLVGWTAAVRLIVILLQRSAALLAVLEAPDLAEMCSLGLLLARFPRGRQTWSAPASLGVSRPSRSRGSTGFTLVEVLLAMALSGLVFTLVAAGFVSTARFSRSTLASGDALSVRAALPAMLQQAVEAVGRGVSDRCALEVGAFGERLGVTFVAEGGTVVHEEVFSAQDGGGRPALYLRRVPHARQPWIEDVTTFRVLDLELDGDGRVAAVDLAIDHQALSDALHVRVSLPHRPCLDTQP